MTKAIVTKATWRTVPMAVVGGSLILAALLLPASSGDAQTGDSGVAKLSSTTLVEGDPTGDLTGVVDEATNDVDDPTGVVKPSTTTSSSTTTSTTSSTTSTSTTTTTVPSTAGGDDDAGARSDDRSAEDPAKAFVFPDLPAFHLPPVPVPTSGLDTFAAFDPTFFYVPVPGRRSTQDVMELLEPLGLSDDEVHRVLAPFPVAGAANYSDDWGAPRTTPYPHRHEGTDIFAEEGTPVVAVGDGTVSRVAPNTAVGGNAVYLTLPDGTYYYYAHLDGFADGLRAGDEVDEGDVLGFVGNTGNAEGTQDHLHFEIHPDGGEATPPIPQLDQWLEDARVEAQGLAGVSPVVDAGGQVVPQQAQGVIPQPVPASISGPDRYDALIWGVLLLAFAAGIVRARIRSRALVAIGAGALGRSTTVRGGSSGLVRSRWARSASLLPKFAERAKRDAARFMHGVTERLPWRAHEPRVVRRKAFDLLTIQQPNHSPEARHSQGDDT